MSREFDVLSALSETRNGLYKYLNLLNEMEYCDAPLAGVVARHLGQAVSMLNLAIKGLKNKHGVTVPPPPQP